MPYQPRVGARIQEEIFIISNVGQTVSVAVVVGAKIEEEIMDLRTYEANSDRQRYGKNDVIGGNSGSWYLWRK